MTWVPSSANVRPSIGRVMTNSPAFGLRKFSTRSRLGRFVGGELVVRFLPGVDEEGRVGLIHERSRPRP